MYGRGSLDDKGMGVMELMTMLLLKRRNVDLARDVIMLAPATRRSAARWARAGMVENHFDDLDPAYVLDEGGTGMRGFFSAGDVFEITVGEKRMVRIRLVARAEPGHASSPGRRPPPTDWFARRTRCSSSRPRIATRRPWPR